MASTTWQYRPGYGWVERDVMCPITGISHAHTAAWIDDETCRICGQSLTAARELAVTR
jgi:hypothetical protein